MRRSVSLGAYASERLDDLVSELVRDCSENRSLSRAEVLTALIYAAPVEPAGLSRLIRYGRMQRIIEEGEHPDEFALERCSRSAVQLGWRDRDDV